MSVSVIAKGLQDAGLSMTADTLPPDQRTVKTFRNLISAMRAAEAEVLGRLDDSRAQLNEALRKNLELHERVRVLEAELLKYRLKEGLDHVASLTTGDRAKLLELAG
jgi:hypothetical protein